jgi:hypothetical protein
VLPARSVALALFVVWPSPNCHAGPLTSPHVELATPESASDAVQEMLTVSATVYVPLLPAYVRTGAVSSTFSPPSVAVAVLPARSAAVPLADPFAPSPTVTGTGHEPTPESASWQWNETVTGALYQPAAFGERSAVAVIVGGVASR